MHLLLGWVTAERTYPCKQLAYPALVGGSEVTLLADSQAYQLLIIQCRVYPSVAAVVAQETGRDNSLRKSRKYFPTGD
ncbi:hypothetical protein J6590_018428 [Homalodisca vitripennis]|nr:hypothetical protein J6590_018428 [Homalodisca vitripennis]